MLEETKGSALLIFASERRERDLRPPSWAGRRRAEASRECAGLTDNPAPQSRFGTKLEPLLRSWRDQGLLGHDTLDDIRQHFFQTRRQHINIIPGFEVSRVWEPSAVQELEENGGLEAALIAAYNEALATWGEALQVMSNTS